MKLEGTLDTFPLRELVEMIAYSSVTGVLNVYGPDSSGHLYFRDGNLYHADRNNQRGLEALASMLEHERGQFAFVSDLTSPEETLWGDIDSHLQAAERLAQRWRQVRAYVPTLELIPELTVGLEDARRRAGPALYALLDLVDGKTSLRAMAEQLGWGEVDVAEAAAQIVLDGVIDLRRAPAPRNNAAAASSQGQRSEGGIFDRILGRASTGLPTPQPVPVPATAQPTPRASGAEEAILRLLRG